MMGFGQRVRGNVARVVGAAEKAVRSFIAQVFGTQRRPGPGGGGGGGGGEAGTPPPSPTGGGDEIFTAEDADSFIYFGGWMLCVSSNVAAMQYDYESKKLIVVYNGGNRNGLLGYYRYPSTDEHAKRAWDAGSKGGFVWDVIRVRGAGNQCKHQGDYVWFEFLADRSTWHPIRPCDMAEQRNKRIEGWSL